MHKYKELSGKPDTDPDKISLRLLPSGPDRVHKEPVQRRLSIYTITSILRRRQPQQRIIRNKIKLSTPSISTLFNNNPNRPKK
jgi:hypothetical protein